MDFLKSLLPEANVLVGYLTAVIVFIICHLLAYANVNLTPEQTATLTGSAGILVAHAVDSFEKIKAKPTEKKES